MHKSRISRIPTVSSRATWQADMHATKQMTKKKHLALVLCAKPTCLETACKCKNIQF